MKKSILAIVLGFAITHYSFTVKTAIAASVIIKCSNVSAQSFYPTYDCHGAMEINQWMSPTNNCGNRFVIAHFGIDTVRFSAHNFILDSAKQVAPISTFAGSDQVMGLTTGGQMVTMSFSNAVISSKSATVSGTALQTAYVITHGLSYTPKLVVIQPSNANSAILNYVDTYNSTSFTVHFLTVPVIGTNNVIFGWVPFK